MRKITKLIKVNNLERKDIAKFLDITKYELNRKITNSDFKLDEIIRMMRLFECNFEDIVPLKGVEKFSKKEVNNLPIITYEENLRDLIDEEGFITIYKYRPYDKFIKDTIINNRIYMSYIIDLNDPFETMAHLVNSRGSTIACLDTQSYAVGSFSLNYNNPMMWALYCQGYNGVCFEIKIKPEELIEKGYLVGRVKYRKKIPQKLVKDYNLEIKDTYDNEIISQALFTKIDVWSSEKEFRIIKPINYHVGIDNKEYLYYTDGDIGKVDNEKVYLENIIISKIILGKNLTEGPTFKIRAWAKQKGIEVVRLKVNIFKGKLTV